MLWQPVARPGTAEIIEDVDDEAVDDTAKAKGSPAMVKSKPTPSTPPPPRSAAQSLQQKQQAAEPEEGTPEWLQVRFQIHQHHHHPHHRHHQHHRHPYHCCAPIHSHSRRRVLCVESRAGAAMLDVALLPVDMCSLPAALTSPSAPRVVCVPRVSIVADGEAQGAQPRRAGQDGADPQPGQGWWPPVGRQVKADVPGQCGRRGRQEPVMKRQLKRVGEASGMLRRQGWCPCLPPPTPPDARNRRSRLEYRDVTVHPQLHIAHRCYKLAERTTHDLSQTTIFTYTTTGQPLSDCVDMHRNPAPRKAVHHKTERKITASCMHKEGRDGKQNQVYGRAAVAERLIFRTTQAMLDSWLSQLNLDPPGHGGQLQH